MICKHNPKISGFDRPVNQQQVWLGLESRSSLRYPGDLGDSAVSVFGRLFTAETQRSRRLRRGKLKYGHYFLTCILDFPD
jgi:hypothetical protein